MLARRYPASILPSSPGRPAVCAAFLLAAAGLPAFAQSVAPSSAVDEPVTVLSPFEVTAEEDRGYLAGTVQSGTRLRMDLKDTAASISVITKDFMTDIGANNLEDLLVYTLGTEVGGAMGNFSDAGVIENPGGSEIDYDNAFGSAMPSTRVRGLTAADVARDFFVSSIPPDGYNIERQEISRGANAMLFGLGSPAGIINASLLRANLQRRKTSVDLQFDKYGSYRGALDHNQVLIKDKLAFRAASMYENNSYRVEEAWEEDKRGYITGTWRPFRNTTIRANYEAAKIESNRPESRPPADAYTHWWHLGKPVYDMSTGASTLMGTAAPGWPSVFIPTNPSAFTGNIISTQIGAMGGGQFQMQLVYNDPLSSTMSIGLPGLSNVGAMRGGNIANVHLNAAGTALVTDGPRGLREMNAIYNRVIYAGTPTANYWKATQITDPAIYDFYHHMMHGQDKLEWAKWHTYNASIEQLLFDGKGGIELSANREKLDNGSVLPLDSTISGYTLRIDINTHLPNGLRNPNFGRPFTDAYTRLVRKSFDRDTMRATGFYDLNFRKTGPEWLGRFLGRHRIQADHTRMTYTSLLEPANFFFNNGPDYYNAVRNTVGQVPATASSASRGAILIRYLGPDVSGTPAPATGSVVTPVSQWPANIDTVSTYFYQSPTSTAPSALNQWEVRDFELVSGTAEDPGPVRRNVAYTREKVNSSVAIAQGYWFEGKLVSTVGVRRDHVQTYNAGTVIPQESTYSSSVLDDRFYPRPVTNTTVDTVNWGVVGHAPEFIRRRLPLGSDISLFYNEADNFRPAGQRYDIFDNAIPHETGETKDYGVVLSTFDGKLRLRIAKYETTSGMSSSLPGSNLTVPLNNLSGFIDTVQGEILRQRNVGNEAGIAAWNGWYNSPTGLALRNTFRVVEIPAAPGDPSTADVDSIRRSGEVVAPSDVTSTGQEYELHFKPTAGWDFTVNVSKSEAVRSNVATALRNVVFNELKPLMDGPAGTLRGSTDPLVNNPAQNIFTGSIYNQMLPRLSEEGLPTTELRKWHWNAVTNYRFTEGRFKGFNIGGAVRWQDKIAIGAPVIDHPVFGFAPDVQHPHYGPSETNYDAWIGYRKKFRYFDWRIQLNVRNIGVGEELIPVAAQPDGSIAGWRIAPEETWKVSTTFTF